MAFKRHSSVKHPSELADIPNTFPQRVNSWVTNHLALALGSMAGLYVSLVIPLLALGIPLVAKLVILVFPGWIQSWALFCLQRTANSESLKREAKEDTDHEALTHIANAVDRIEAKDA